MIERKFVLEAGQVVLKYGGNIHVNSSTNFVSLSGDTAVVQISPLNTVSGPNGIGGITLDGTASNIRIYETKKKDIRLNMNVSGIGISAQIEIQLIYGNNRTNVTINPNFNLSRIEQIGKVVPFKDSNAFKGISL